MARGLPAFRPGNYDIAVIGNDLWVATPIGLWKFDNKGVPNSLRHLHIDFTANGLTIPSFDDLEVEPASIGFTTTHKKSSSAPIHGRYRINNDPRIVIDTVAPVNWGRGGFFMRRGEAYGGRFHLEVVERGNGKTIGGKVDVEVAKGIGHPFIIKFPQSYRCCYPQIIADHGYIVVSRSKSGQSASHA